MTPGKLSSDERRSAILSAVLPLFAREGAERITTRQLAEAAGVSEALLYRHFPSKEHLFGALHEVCLGEGDSSHALIHELEANTVSLVLGLHWLMKKTMLGDGDQGEVKQRAIRRLILSSCLEDGVFAREFIANKTALMIDRLTLALEAAVQSGDVARMDEPPRLRLWLAIHAAFGAAALSSEPLEPPIIDYGVPYADLLAPAVRFALRGLGMSDATIHRYYNPTALQILEGGTRAP